MRRLNRGNHHGIQFREHGVGVCSRYKPPLYHALPLSPPYLWPHNNSLALTFPHLTYRGPHPIILIGQKLVVRVWWKRKWRRRKREGKRWILRRIRPSVLFKCPAFYHCWPPAPSLSPPSKSLFSCDDVWERESVCVCVYVWARMYVWMYVRVHVCACIPIYESCAYIILHTHCGSIPTHTHVWTHTRVWTHHPIHAHYAYILIHTQCTYMPIIHTCRNIITHNETHTHCARLRACAVLCTCVNTHRSAPMYGSVYINLFKYVSIY